MWKVYLSRWVNFYLLGGRRDQMVSSRAYAEHHPRTERFINAVFFWQDNHCRRTFLWEKRHEAHQKATRQSQEASRPEQEDSLGLETQAEGGA